MPFDAGGGLGGAVEAFGDVWQRLAGNTDAGVADFEKYVVARGAHYYVNLSLRGILDGVVQHVSNDLLQEGFDAVQPGAWRQRCRQHDPPGAGAGCKKLLFTSDQFGEVHRGERKDRFGLVQAAQQQQVLHEPCHLLGLIEDLAQGGAVAIRRAWASQGQLRLTLENGQWCFQLVGCVGRKASKFFKSLVQTME